MKSKDIDLIFWESLNYKSGVGFFVPALVLFFEVSTRALSVKVAILRGQKMALPVLVQKIQSHFCRIKYHKYHFIIIKKVTKTKSVILKSKGTSNKKIEENRPVLNFHFTSESMCEKSEIVILTDP